MPEFNEETSTDQMTERIFSYFLLAGFAVKYRLTALFVAKPAYFVLFIDS